MSSKRSSRAVLAVDLDPDCDRVCSQSRELRPSQPSQTEQCALAAIGARSRPAVPSSYEAAAISPTLQRFKM